MVTQRNFLTQMKMKGQNKIMIMIVKASGSTDYSYQRDSLELKQRL